MTAIDRGRAAELAGDIAEAERLYLDAIPENPIGAQQLLGLLKSNYGSADEAEAWFRAAVDVAPERPRARYSLAQFLLRLGRYAEAWPFYESRRELFSILSLAEELPEWRGEALEGRRLLVLGEQGYGDQIMFARFAEQLRAEGASVDYACSPPLASAIPGATPLFDLKQHPAADLWAVAGSLPLRLGTTLETVPPPLSLGVESKGGAGIGVVVRGNPANERDQVRSLPQDLAAELLSIGRDLAPEATGARNFLDTARIVAWLDLVITVDTAVAHLAASMGKPTWVLLPYLNPDWRWLKDRRTSPWYPSATLYRQSTPGDWRGVLDEVRRDLG